MLTLRLASLVLVVGAIPMVLAGCPEGAGHGEVRQDGGADAKADATHDGATEDDGGGGDGAVTEGGGGPMGSGALCGPNGRDDCGAFLLCNASLGCVECVQDSDCPAAAGRCLSGTCAGCRPAMSDCPGAGSACWGTDNECHPACGDGNACPAGSMCDRTSGACVGCAGHSDCASGGCSPATRKCVECLADSSCSGARPRCRALTGTCEACTSNEDCGHSAPICDPTTFTCRVGCTTDAQCPGQQCHAPTAKCVDLPIDAGIQDAGSGG